MERLQEISRCMVELESCRAQMQACPHDPLLVLLGQMDWLTELHRCIHQERP